MSTLPFGGPATRLSSADMIDLSAAAGIPARSIRAVVAVECGQRGGFLPSGKPTILFESRHFSTATGGKYDASNPRISTPTWVHNYLGGEAEYSRLQEAYDLDPDAALSSASWGMGQIMGANFGMCGYPNVNVFVAGMYLSERVQLQAMLAFLHTSNLAPALLATPPDFAAFARGYNGPGQVDLYAAKLSVAWASALGVPDHRTPPADAPAAAEISRPVATPALVMAAPAGILGFLSRVWNV
jgi:N-acetylmuramidase